MPKLLITVVKTCFIVFLLANSLAAQPKTDALGTPFGQHDVSLLAQLRNDAAKCYADKQLTEAIALLQKVLKVESRLYGRISAERAATLEKLAQWKLEDRDYCSARKSCSEVHEILHSLFGESNWRVVDAKLTLKDIDRYESFSDREHQQLVEVEARHQKAANLSQLGQYAGSLRLTQKNVAVYRDLMGSEHSNYATLLNNLATLHLELANFEKVERLLEESLSIQRHLLGDKHPGVATALHNLGRFYYDVGDYRMAEETLSRALNTKALLYGKHSSSYVSTLQSLATTLVRKGDRKAAAARLSECLDLLKKNSTTDMKSGKEFAVLLNNLGEQYWSNGEPELAEKLIRKCLELKEKVFGTQDLRYVSTLSNLAHIERSKSNLDLAEELYSECLETVKSSVGKSHPQYAEAVSNLALVAQLRGDYATAAQLSSKSLQASEELLGITVAAQSERQELRMRAVMRKHLDQCLAICLKHPPSQQQAYEALLRWKGAAFARQRRLRITAHQPALNELNRQLQQLASQLSSWSLSVPAKSDSANWRNTFEDLSKHKEKVERELSIASQEYRVYAEPPTLASLKAALSPETALVDFIEFSPLAEAAFASSEKSESNRKILAFVVRHDKPLLVHLIADVREIQDRMTRWLTSFGERADSQDAGQWLRRTLWEPLEAGLSGIDTVLLSPDGQLSALPFGALPGKQPNTYLIEQYRFAVIPVPQLLASKLPRSQRLENSTDLLLMGGIDYGSKQGKSPKEFDNGRPAIKLFARSSHAVTQWESLPGAEKEIVFIKDLFEQHLPSSRITVRRGTEASESSFRNLAPRSRILHLATHGYFSKTTLDSDAESHEHTSPGNRFSGLRHVAIRDLNSGVLSGLVFAGANQRQSKAGSASQSAVDDIEFDDGVLTAAEAALLPLGNVQLAILSACDSGLGTEVAGEGLLGIQRGFQIAGVKSTIASLWKVNDLATRRIMERFYRNCVKDDMSPLDALRSAQIWALHNSSLVPRGHIEKLDSLPEMDETNRLPFQYWAAFTLSGEWK